MKPVEWLYNVHINKGTRPSIDEISRALQYVLAKISAVYIEIDAIDECQDSDGTRRLFLAKLQELQAKTDLRMMVTSRIIPDIIDRFKMAKKLEVRASDEDVKRFYSWSC